MRTLVTGSEGFIGKNLVSVLQDKDFEISELELNDFYSENFQTKLQEFLKEERPEVIFHVGACSDTLEQNVNLMMELNYETTKVLTDWAKANDAKVIYSSSAASYGQGSRPSNLYGWSKYAAEGYVISNGGVALRYFNVYGPGEEHKGIMSSVAFQSFMKQKEEKEILLFPGNPKRDFVYVADVVGANIYALKNWQQISGDWYDVGSFTSRTFEDVLKGIGVFKWGYHQPKRIPEGYQFLTQAKKCMPGWAPKYNLEQGLKEYEKYLTRNG